MFEPNIFVKKPFSNGTGNPAIVSGYNMNTYNNPFGNPSTSLGFEGSVTIPNYQDFVNQTVNTAVNAAIGAVTGGANYSQNHGDTGSSGGSDGGTSNLQPTGINLQNALNVVKEPDMKAFQQSVERAVRKANNQLFDPNDSEESFSDKFSNSTFGKDFDKWSQGLNIANNLFTTFAGEKDEYSGAKGGMARGIDSAYDTVQSVVSSFGPIGKAASLIMGGNKLLGNVMNKIGGGTSGMTTTDAILNSSFLQLTPLGLINGFGGKKAMTITKDNQAFAQVGSSYSGTSFAVDNALSKSGKKYGLFSLGARDKANREILDARRQQQIMANIADTASDRFALSDSMAAINNSRMALDLMGGYDQSSVRVGKAGMVLQLARKINSRLSNSILQEVTDIPKEFLEVSEFKEGGQIPQNYEILKEITEIPVEFLEIDEFKEGGSISQKIKDYYKEYDLSNVTLINDSSPRTEGNVIYSPDDEYTVHELWHYLSQNKPNEALKEFYDQIDDTKLQKFGADLDFVKRTGDPSDFYHPSELEARLKAAKFMSQGALYDKEFFKNLRSDENKYGNNMRDLLRMFNDEYLEKLFNALSKFKKGGKFNIIPEGALHARKHNMDVENITQKGIPVVSESADGEIVQQAEIERQEIIFRLEVTKKLEELAKDGSDEAAIEAGKLLVQEIIYNTIDNTNTLL